MKKLYAFIRHNSGIVIGSAMIPLALFFVYSCQSTVVSLVQTNRKVTRSELIAEVDLILAQAAAKFEDLDRQDLVKSTIFNSVLDLAQGKTVNPIGVLLTLAGVLGAGAGVDNIRKRTHIKTLKGGNVNAKNQETIKDTNNVPTPPKIID